MGIHLNFESVHPFPDGNDEAWFGGPASVDDWTGPIPAIGSKIVQRDWHRDGESEAWLWWEVIDVLWSTPPKMAYPNGIDTLEPVAMIDVQIRKLPPGPNPHDRLVEIQAQLDEVARR